MNFANLTGLSDSYGNVVQIADAAGNVIWALAADEPAAILEVTKATISSIAGETEYTDESVVLLDIYPKKNGTVKVTYGDVTKTITDTSGVDEPNAQQVFFGTFCGVSDSVTTPDSGNVIIEGAYRGYGRGIFTNSKNMSAYCPCVTGVVDFGNPVIIGTNTFYQCTSLALTSLPSGLTYIGDNAFYGCTSLTLTSLPDSLTYIERYAFYDCYNICITEMPPNLKHIGNMAFYISTIPTEGFTSIAMFDKTITLPSTIELIGSDAFATSKTSGSDSGVKYTYLGGVIMLSTTPPTVYNEPFGDGEYFINNTYNLMVITVPVGCGDIYKAADGWSQYAYHIVEAS